MDTSTSKEFLKVYEQISKLQKDITDVAKDCYDISAMPYLDIDIPNNLSDFNNDTNFATQEEVDSKILQAEELYLKVDGLESLKCNVKTEFKELLTVTKDSEDSSENVATTRFVHDVVSEGNSNITMCLAGKADKHDVVDINSIRKEINKSEVSCKDYTDESIRNSSEDIISQFNDIVLLIDIPTKTSDLVNDNNFITISDIPDDLVTSVNGKVGDVQIDIPTIPTNVSAFVNDSGYITDPGVTSVNNQTGSVSVQENVQADWSATSGLALILHKPALKRVATTGDYNDLDNLPVIPVIPTNISAFTNDAGYLTEHQDISNKLELDDLADVAVSGNYADLKNTPEIPTIPKNISAFVNNVGYLTSETDPTVPSWAKQQNKPSYTAQEVGALPSDTLLFSGDYNDLSNKPTIPTVPTNVSAFVNDAGYITSANIPDTTVQNYYLVELNLDGSVKLSASSITYNTISANLTNPRKVDYLDVIWENGANTNQFTRFYAQAVEVVEVNSGDIKFIGDVEYAGILRRIVFTLNANDVLTTTSITTFEIISNKKNSVVNNLSDNYYASTNAIYNEFLRKPVTVWETNGTGLLSSDQDIKESMTWQLTGLDMSPYKRVKIYTKAGKKTSGVGQDASNTPAAVLEMSLDNRAASPTGGHFIGSVVGQKPNDANRFFTVTCAISSDKTSFAVLRMSTLYGTAATANSDCNGYVFKIEGYYD